MERPIMSEVDTKKEKLTGVAAMKAELPDILAKLASKEMLSKDLSEVEAWLADYVERFKDELRKELYLKRQKAKETQESC
jgi:hypothetical protein